HPTFAGGGEHCGNQLTFLSDSDADGAERVGGVGIPGQAFRRIDVAGTISGGAVAAGEALQGGGSIFTGSVPHQFRGDTLELLDEHLGGAVVTVRVVSVGGDTRLCDV